MLSRSIVLAAALSLPAALMAQVPQIAPQTFTADPAHTTVIFGIDHIGYSTFIASFDDIAASLVLDVADPASARLSVTIPVASLDLPSPPPGFFEQLMSESWFDAANHPNITFVSDRIALTGEDTAQIEGTLTLRGVSQPVTLTATYNGGYDGEPWEPWARLGFSATTEFSRSAFGMDYGLPTADMPGVGDTVRVTIETEWIGEKVR